MTRPEPSHPLWDQPVTRDGHFPDVRGVAPQTLLPGLKINGTRIRSQDDELRECEPGPIRDVDGRLERGGAVARESEDKRAKDVHTMIAERSLH